MSPPDKPRPPEGKPSNPATELSADNREVWARAFQLLAHLDQLHGQIQRVLDIHPSEARALLAVWSTGGLAAGDLARQVKLSNAATTTLIDRLEHRKLVKRSRSGVNKRFVIVTATPLAQERIASIGRHFQERFEHALDTDPAQARNVDQAIAALQRLLDETITTLRLTPVEVFPARHDDAPPSIRTFQTSDD